MALIMIQKEDKIAKMREELAEAGLTPLMLYHDKKNFAKYKNGDVDLMGTDTDLAMCVLDILERLGFPMDEMGTYLFKNMLIKIARLIDELNEIDGKEILQEVKKQVIQPYSQFYLDLARNELDMGITTFHYHLIDMIKRIDFTRADEKLLKLILGGTSDNLSYGELALVIGSYLAGTLKTNMNKQSMVNQVGLISSAPKFSLKYNEDI